MVRCAPLAALRQELKVTSSGISLSRHIALESRRDAESDPVLPMLVQQMALAAKQLAREFRRAAQDEEWEYLTGDQACLNRVLYKDWTGMPLSIQAHAGHIEARVSEAFILHFLGTNPWDEVPKHLLPYPGFKLNARKLWREYYREGAGVDFHMDVREVGVVNGGGDVLPPRAGNA